MSNQKKIENKPKKFTLRQFCWDGFNLTVGVTFLGSLALLVNPDFKGNYQLGLNIIWIFALMGLITGSCAFAFAKLSRYHNSDNNGGAYIFVRSAFGRFVGFLVLFINYIIMPLTIVNQILYFVTINLDPIKAGGGWWSNWVPGSLGNWSSLTFDLMGIALSVVFILVAILGAKLYRKFNKHCLWIKWASAGFFILFAIVSACLPTNSNNAAEWAQHSNINGPLFLKAFCTCFYFFTGFESFASAGATVEEPEKNVGKGIMIVMFCATTFYVVLTTIFLLAIYPNQINSGKEIQNINTSFWNIFQQNKWLKWLIFAGPIIMFINTITTRGNTICQTVLYGGTTLQPMCVEGYISNKFDRQNADGFPIGAMRLNIIITAITIGIWTLIPDIIVGINPNADFVDVNTFIDASSVFYIAIYSIVILALLKFSFKNIIKTNIYEIILYFVSLTVLALVFGYFFYDLFKSALDPSVYLWTDSEGVHNDQIKNIVSLCIQMFFIIACILFVVIVYFAYYKKKYQIRLKNSPNIQKKLNYEFRVLDGWKYMQGLVTQVLKKEKMPENIRNEKLIKIYLRFILTIKRINKYNLHNGNNTTLENKNHYTLAKQAYSKIGQKLFKF